MREHDVTGLAAGELERARRDLQASLALLRPDSPARPLILAYLRAADAELARRALAGDGHDDQPAGPAAGPARQAAYRCACGYTAGSVTLLEDHLSVFPEDDHYELAADAPFPR